MEDYYPNQCIHSSFEVMPSQYEQHLLAKDILLSIKKSIVYPNFSECQVRIYAWL